MTEDDNPLRYSWENHCGCLWEGYESWKGLGKQVAECPLHREMRLRALPEPGSKEEDELARRVSSAVWEDEGEVVRTWTIRAVFRAIREARK